MVDDFSVLVLEDGVEAKVIVEIRDSLSMFGGRDLGAFTMRQAIHCPEYMLIKDRVFGGIMTVKPEDSPDGATGSCNECDVLCSVSDCRWNWLLIYVVVLDGFELEARHFSAVLPLEKGKNSSRGERETNILFVQVRIRIFEARGPVLDELGLGDILLHHNWKMGYWCHLRSSQR